MKKTKKNAKEPVNNIITGLVKSKGFYIALCSLAVIAGISIYARNVQNELKTRVASFDDEAWKEAVEESGIEIVDVDKPSTAANQDNTSGNQALSQKTEASVPAVAASAVPEKRTEAPKFSMQAPCSGNIIAECSVDELVYCSTMEDWRTHNGIDFAADIGTAVTAAEDGIVSKVYEDELLGIVVELDHQNGISSVYGNLQSFDFIKTGTEVKQGDIIGGVGEPGALEADAEPHLHFEVIENGEHKNPREYFKN